MDTIMIFAAGFGSRLKHISQETPKPLVHINGKPIIYYAIENAIKHGFKHIVINTHYMHEKIKDAIDYFISITPSCPKISIIHEEGKILETGGGLKNALKIIDREYVFTCNSDVIISSDIDFFSVMESHFDANIMDILILLHKTKDAIGYTGIGDFEMNSNGNLILRPSGFDSYKYMNAGVHLLKTSIIENNPSEIFSLSNYYHPALNGENKLYGLENIGKWCHLSSPEDLIEIEMQIKDSIKNT